VKSPPILQLQLANDKWGWIVNEMSGKKFCSCIPKQKQFFQRFFHNSLPIYHLQAAKKGILRKRRVEL
jgi:hypothetical protein